MVSRGPGKYFGNLHPSLFLAVSPTSCPCISGERAKRFTVGWGIFDRFPARRRSSVVNYKSRVKEENIFSDRYTSGSPADGLNWNKDDSAIKSERTNI